MTRSAWSWERKTRNNQVKHKQHITICISNSGESCKYQVLWLASASSHFDSEVLRNRPLLLHLTLCTIRGDQIKFNFRYEIH